MDALAVHKQITTQLACGQIIPKNFKQKQKLFTSVKNMEMVTPSVWLADVIEQSFLSKYNVNTIYNGINWDIFKPTALSFAKKNGLENKKIVLGVANVWDERKGIDDFIRLKKLLDDS